MIFITANSVNTFYLTLREKSLLWNVSGVTPYYLFAFFNPTTNNTVYFNANDIASLSAQSRYDEFTIIETATTYVNLTAGTVNLYPGINWEYTIYEQQSQFNLNPQLTIGVVEYGKVQVTGYTGFQFQSLNSSANTSFQLFNF